METVQYLWVIAAFLISGIIVFFQYFFRNGSVSKYNYYLAFFRFLSVSALLLLIFNIQIKRKIIETVKPKLILLADNSLSIRYKNQDSIEVSVIESLSNDKRINNKFDIQYFNFGKELKRTKLLRFDDTETNIEQALSKVDELFKEDQTVVILLTDGNQTYGADYTYYKADHQVFPVILGDTTRSQDLFISNLNVNAYTYLEHKFPVELFVNYNGTNKIESVFRVYNKNRVIYKMKLKLSDKEKSKKINFFLPALSKGKHFYRAEIVPLDSEKNTLNNVKNFSIEVLDESSKILLLYDVLHPDIAFWKRTVESNKQRKIEIRKIDDVKSDISDYQFVILYQPNYKFKNILLKNINFLIHTGTRTDWNSLNRNQKFFHKEYLSETQDVVPVYNKDFSSFQVKNIDFNKLPPLQNIFGGLTFNTRHQTLLFQGIENIPTEVPLISTLEKGNRRIILIDGENIFAWRSYSYLKNKTFENFDGFTNSLFQFLQDQGNRKTLDVQFKPIYFENEKVIIKAVKYNANYFSDTISQLEMMVINKELNYKRTFPMFLNGNIYEAGIQDLNPGIYDFQVVVKDQDKKFSGQFKILSYNQEQYHLRSDYSGLKALADRNKSTIYTNQQLDDLKNVLLKSGHFVSIQKEIDEKQSLIDWKWLLSLIILSLSFEWFIRKYYGLI